MADTTTRPPNLHLRHRLVDLPPLVIPAGYSLRTLTADDGPAFARLLARNGELGAWDLARAAPYFTPPGALDLDGSFFVERAGEPVATAQLHRHRDDQYAPLPELGWVATSPEHRGQGLGFAVCLAVLRYAVAAGYPAIFLITQPHRLVAIRVYLKLGFSLWPRDAADPENWRAVVATLAANGTVAGDARRPGGTIGARSG